MRLIETLMLITVAASLTSCGFVKNLRRELEDEDGASSQASADEFDYYRDPANRYKPLPPANVSDSRTAVLSGTPLDLSGVRAKNLRTTAQNFFAETNKAENSLWSDEGQNNYLFAKNKLKMPGDLVTVMIEDRLRNDMVSSVRKLLPPEYRAAEIVVPGLTKAAEKTDRALASATTAAATSDGALASEDMLTAEVLERYPNGNVRIRGIKRVPFKRAVRNIEVLAIVRGTDISEDDVVKSSKFFEQRVELYK